MTPAERDEVRGLAERHLAYHPGSLRTCTDCLNARAVLRYVPPGDASDHLLARVDRPGYATCRHPGHEYVETAAHLRDRAHALHAAADAAEENDR